MYFCVVLTYKLIVMSNNNYSIELLEENDNVNIYTLRYKGDTLNEFEKFLTKFPTGSEYDEDIDIIISWLEKIEQKGALERYFRPEHKYGDNIGAIPIEYGRVRLYCLRISDKILIVGNGDIKTTAKWQEDKKLIPHVELLIDTGKFIKSRISNGTIILSDKEIIGNLKFSR